MTGNPFLSEDSPAPNALHSFKAHVADGKIHVTANPASTLKDNKDRQPKLMSSISDYFEKGIVIVGGGSGAFHAIESLREVCSSAVMYVNNRYPPSYKHGFKHPITIISKEPYTPIDRFIPSFLSYLHELNTL
jgi:hypothetical protein